MNKKKMLHSACASWFIAAALLLLSLSSCGGGGGGGDSHASGGNDSGVMTSTTGRIGSATDTVAAASSAVSKAVLQQIDNSNARVTDAPGSSNEPVSVDVACEGGGTAHGTVQILSLTGTPTFQLSLAGQIDLANCGGLNGSFALTIDALVQNKITHLSIGVNGEIFSSQCNIAFQSFTITADIDENNNTVNELVNGGASAQCQDTSMICQWMNIPAEDEAALEAGCS